MPGAEQIDVSSTLVVAVIAAVVGFAALWSNPDRLVNRGFCAASVFVALWLICLDQTFAKGGQFWSRATAIAGVATIVPTWFIKEAIVNDGSQARTILVRVRGWIFACLVLGVIRTNNLYIGDINLSFYVFVVGLTGMYGVLGAQTVKEMKVCTGLKRLELQIAALGGCATGLTVMLLLIVRVAGDVKWVMRLLPAVVLLFYTATVVAMTTSRVFNARQLLLVAFEKLLLVLTVATVASLVQGILEKMLPVPVALCATTALALWIASDLSSRFDRIFHFYPEGASARQAALSAAQRDSRTDLLENSFQNVLRGWGQANHAFIVSGSRDDLSVKGVDAATSSLVISAMRQLSWATPERLARERQTPERLAVAQFLVVNGLGAVVLVEGPSLTSLVGVGVPASRRPFTYPQVTQLIELASIMEGALERAHFSAKAQHAEQLATVGLLGASLAHEIRNPLVSIKTFVQLLPTHHHDPRFRDKFFRLIGDEVGRIDQLTEQLLDLASPRTYEAKMIELHPLLQSSIDLVAAKAAHRDVQLLMELTAAPDAAYTDASAAKQVMLNLCFNAIQAIESVDGGGRWIKIATRNTRAGIEMAIADSGPGIAPEIRPKLFQPFQTTKSTGFGLGLAICSDILANLNASITVDPPESGCGATFRVTFPCHP